MSCCLLLEAKARELLQMPAQLQALDAQPSLPPFILTCSGWVYAVA